MKTTYVNDLGIVDVPFNTLREGEVVLVKSTDGSVIHRLLVSTAGDCSDCPYRSTTGTRFSCGAKWYDIPPSNIMQPLCNPFIHMHKTFVFKDLYNIMEDL